MTARITSVMNADRNKVCRLISLEQHHDERGSLSVVEPEQAVGFTVRRVYYLHGVESSALRGGHAHRSLEQLIIAVHGGFTITIDDGLERAEYQLGQSDVGLYVGPMVWRSLSEFSVGAVCLVLASDRYDEADYYRDYSEFLQASRRQP